MKISTQNNKWEEESKLKMRKDVMVSKINRMAQEQNDTLLSVEMHWR